MYWHERPLSRRDFLARAAGLAALAAAGIGADDLAAWAEEAAGFPILVGGEDFGAVHDLRDGAKFEFPAPGRTADVVVVGGGISGLTAGYLLRDLDVVVLDKEPKAGGLARRGQWRGIYYSEGTSYFSEPDDDTGAFYEELKVPMKPIARPTDRFLVGGKDFAEAWDHGGRNLPFADRVRRNFTRFRKAVESVSPEPLLPVEKTSAASLKLDRISLAQWARPYGPEITRMLDLYCRSAMGGRVQDVSAFWGLNFYGAEFSPALTLPGGTAGMAEILAARIDTSGAGRVLTGASAVRVAPRGDRSVHVTYMRQGRPHTIAARAAIVAISKHYARHIIPGLPADQAAAMAALRYEPYLVINLMLSSRPYKAAYDTWVDGAAFTDFIVADWTAPSPGRRESVLTVMCPIDPAERGLLLDADLVKARVARVVSDLASVIPGLRDTIIEARAFSWGHPLVLSAVGALKRLQPKLARPFGPVLFANTDGQVCACVEAAVWEGKKAASQARNLLRKSTYTRPRKLQRSLAQP